MLNFLAVRPTPLSILAWNLGLAGTLYASAKAAFDAGVEVGCEQGVDYVRNKYYNAAMPKESNILVPQRQLWLPGVR
jgi:hypothetical protein